VIRAEAPDFSSQLLPDRDPARHRKRGATTRGSSTLVAYPKAGHGFDLGGPSYREEESDDAWRRMLAALRRHHPR
jgi:dienelactone hydrolase